ncbi:MAG TPA: TonB-dependent receptor, partial [Gemmatimonadaceae bacterium]|nr:TonB-dependent receptor [Gemmatimonadaceae bacterium]
NLSFSAASARPLTDTAAAPLPEGDALLAGTVLRIDGTPIAGAQVQVLGTAAATRTDDQGRFTLGRLPAGSLELEVRRLGFGVVRRTVDLRGGRTTRTEVRLERAIALDSISVVAKRLKYPDFETRRRFSIDGKFLDEDEIRQRHPSNTSDLLYTLPGFWVVGTGAAATVVSTRAFSLGGYCEANIVIDNMRNQRINDVPASQVAALESYPKGGAPLQYGPAPCGMVVIWTKR